VSVWVDLAGVVFGVFGMVLAVAMLLAQHREAPMVQRMSVGLIGLLCFATAVNACVSVRSMYGATGPSPIAVGFAFAISLNWFYRLLRRRRRPLTCSSRASSSRRCSTWRPRQASLFRRPMKRGRL
jgi:hypothetical protein